MDSGPIILLKCVPGLRPILHKIGILVDAQMVAVPKGIIFRKIPLGLKRYPDGVADRIYTSHCLEHLTDNLVNKTLAECHRILCKNGILRIVLPDTLFFAKRYIENTQSLIEDNIASEKHRDILARHVAGAFIDRWRTGHRGHRSCWDIPSMRHALMKAGFSKIEVCNYQEGKDKEFAKLDTHPIESFHIEVIK